MTDPGSVAAAYAVVLGGLGLYVASVVRRLRSARRTTEAVRREQIRDAQPTDPSASSTLASGPSEPTT